MAQQFSKRIDEVIKLRNAQTDRLADIKRIPLISSGPYEGVGFGTSTTNGDEKQADFRGNFTKGLEHDAKTGLVANPSDYGAFIDALDARNTDYTFPSNVNGIDAIRDAYKPALANTSADPKAARPLVNPLAGVAADVTGIDPAQMIIPPAPKLDSFQAGAELVELYWMALLRDVPFDELANSNMFETAIRELNALNNTSGEKPFAQHYIRSPNNGSLQLDPTIDASTIFRGSAPGNNLGGFISQFLLHDVSFGTLDFEQKQRVLQSNRNYMTTRPEWLEAQNGKDVKKSRHELEGAGGSGRHIVTLRDLAHYVHFDALHEAYFNAALILDGMHAKAPKTNPYHGSSEQEGFGTLGGPHVLAAVTEVATRALKAVWHQKWFVHRRLRPEAMAARVEYHAKGMVHDKVRASKALETSIARNGSQLLPMAFAEGSPMHPSYGAGHATVAGACVTILKAFFDTAQAMPRVVKVQREANGNTRLVEDTGTYLTVGGELNKLAANIAIGRNAGGVHYRTDYTASLALGEVVALAMLQEQAACLREGAKDDIAFRIDRFDGSEVEITYGGKIK